MPPNRFPLGRVLITTHAAAVLNAGDVANALARHAAGDWGDVCEEDRLANERALRERSRLLSSYTDRGGNTFWIITERDFSTTTVLLPQDY